MGSVLLDPWSTSVATEAARNGLIHGISAVCDRSEENGEKAQPPPVPIGGAEAAAAEDAQQQTGPPTSLSSKFNLPRPSTLQILRSAYYASARPPEKYFSEDADKGRERPSSDAGREAKRLRLRAPGGGRRDSDSGLEAGSGAGGGAGAAAAADGGGGGAGDGGGAGAGNGIGGGAAGPPAAAVAEAGANPGAAAAGSAAAAPAPAAVPAAARTPKSRPIGPATLQRLCAALGVVIQQERIPAYGLSYAVASSRGWRSAMEDAYAAEVPLGGQQGLPLALFAMYDGHGGAEVARYSALHMGRAIRTAPSYRPPPSHDAEADGPASSPADPDPTSASAPTTPTAAAAPSASSPLASPTAAPSAAPFTSAASAAPSIAASASASEPPSSSSASPPGPLPPHAAALREAFLALDQQLGDPSHAAELIALANPGAVKCSLEEYGRRFSGGPYVGPGAGSTATVALVGPQGLTVAYVGDSRCILGSRQGGAVPLSVDHKASDPVEKERVLQAGAWVSHSGRVCGDLDMSRAMGDADLKRKEGLPAHQQAVTADPGVTSLGLEPLAAARRRRQSQSQQQPAASGEADEAGPSAGGSPRGVDSHFEEEEAQALGSLSLQSQSELTRAAGAGPSGSGAGGGAGSADGTGAGPSAAGGGEGEGAAGEGGFPGTYLLLASDGLWNVLSTAEVHEFVATRLDAGLGPDTIAAQLAVEACVNTKTAYDNVSVLLVLLHGVRPLGQPVRLASLDEQVAALAAAGCAAAPPAAAAGTSGGGEAAAGVCSTVGVAGQQGDHMDVDVDVKEAQSGGGEALGQGGAQGAVAEGGGGGDGSSALQGDEAAALRAEAEAALAALSKVETPVAEAQADLRETDWPTTAPATGSAGSGGAGGVSAHGGTARRGSRAGVAEAGPAPDAEMEGAPDVACRIVCSGREDAGGGCALRNVRGCGQGDGAAGVGRGCGADAGPAGVEGATVGMVDRLLEASPMHSGEMEGVCDAS
ncbi:hypothetical protein HYH03_016942 [Edaphochlamys debaryana]|uniref:protein-serine/threonine phosphatase n=1 Tax=Edaphochlamys debaryana TaxID=47281 RepID=A0A835XJA7_9CHLO|nr:hypothetical protein HYH03_016942 [Edaphochlamys debaryana]|eukprot:KAG2484207.1 hypothetical protein HYH03_016942 [Edaphochlamys debaryana]